MRKKVDGRVRTLIDNGAALNHRGIVVIIGDKGRDQVVNLHYMMTKARAKAKPSVLWCYKKDLGFSSHQRKRMRQTKGEIKRGVRADDTHDPFELFLTSTDIRYTYYRDSHKILGKTFGMCILQDFEALTPNLLARTIETVEGGGLVILLLKTMSSLKSLYSMSMDVHSRFRTESHQDVVGRFNERFILSLTNCATCLVVDDELNVLPISSHMTQLKAVSTSVDLVDPALVDLQLTMKGTAPVSQLVDQCRTIDQATSLMQLISAIQESHNAKSVVSITAARGRGKSACLGLAVAGAVACGVSNIFVCAPSPENLSTFFTLIFKGFDVLDYAEHVDYDIITSKTSNEIVKVIVHHDNHRQTIQYIHPKDSHKLINCELLVVDEAAAIPLTLVKDLLGSYLTFLSSTINGYEGTGRSLSLKLFSELRRSKSQSAFLELQLDAPIRYSSGDGVERWLNALLCLDCQISPLMGGAPHPSQCELYYVNRDTLFSHHPTSEKFLHAMMALFVHSHYKNSPNDLQLMSDAPAHHLFVLLGPRRSDSPDGIPDILAVVQVALEGSISRASVRESQARGLTPHGDLIPWTIAQQFQDDKFAELSAARIVRIATHPSAMRMGYGSRALSLLRTYYSGEMASLSESDQVPGAPATVATNAEGPIVPRSNLPPIMEPLSERPAESLQYLGTSFGVTQSLFNFWRKAGYVPLYCRQTTNELTGENTVIMINPIRETQPTIENDNWINGFEQDFRKRFISLLPISFGHFNVQLALSLCNSHSLINDKSITPTDQKAALGTVLDIRRLNDVFTPYDLRRLECYGKNLVDYHLIMDLVPTLARLSFTNQLPINISYVQAALLLGIGLQFKSVTQMQIELNIESHQILALFNKVVRKMVSFLTGLQVADVKSELNLKKPVRTAVLPIKKSLKSELSEGGYEAHAQIKSKQDKLLQSIGDLEEYAISGDHFDDQVAAAVGAVVPKTISIKTDKKRKSGEGTTERHVDKKSKTSGGKSKTGKSKFGKPSKRT